MGFQKGHKLSPKKVTPPIVAEKVELPEGITIRTYPEGATPDIHMAKMAEETVKNIAKFAEKKKRVPVGLRDPSHIDDSNLDLANFHYHRVRGARGRVEKFLDGGYEMVEGDFKIGDPNIARASNIGSVVATTSGDNEDRVYLMRIPIDLYNEDQAAKQGKIDATEQQLKQRPKDQGLEGEIKLNR